MIFVVDSDRVMAKCMEKAILSLGEEVRVFENVIEAMNGVDEAMPSLIFMEVMLTGPDAWTFLNEMASYTDTAKIPVVLVSTIDFAGVDLSDYGVVGAINKDVMTPDEIKRYVLEYAG